MSGVVIAGPAQVIRLRPCSALHAGGVRLLHLQYMLNHLGGVATTTARPFAQLCGRRSDQGPRTAWFRFPPAAPQSRGPNQKVMRVSRAWQLAHSEIGMTAVPRSHRQVTCPGQTTRGTKGRRQMSGWQRPRGGLLAHACGQCAAGSDDLPRLKSSRTGEAIRAPRLEVSRDQ
jgi:hypothetical protein